MADEPVTETQNSTQTDPATQTDASAATETPSSTTPQSEQATPPSDPLDEADGLAVAPKKEGEEGEAEAKPEEVNPLFGAPEGEYELALPEGMALDKAALDQVTPLAKELGLSNEGLTKLASEAYPIVEGQVSNALVQRVVTTRREWADSTRTMIGGGKDAEGNAIAADPAFGGLGYDEVQTHAARAIDRFAGDRQFPGVKPDGSPGTFREFLAETGLGNHPAMTMFAFIAGKSIGEDQALPRGGDVPPATLSRAEKYYGADAR